MESFSATSRTTIDVRVPSNRAQTLLSKTALEFIPDLETIAAIAVSSKSIQNSSLAANFLSTFYLDEKSIPLISAIFSPETSQSVQFVPDVAIDLEKPVAPNLIVLATEWLNNLKRTKYHHDSIKSFSISGEGHSKYKLAQHFLMMIEEENAMAFSWTNSGSEDDENDKEKEEEKENQNNKNDKEDDNELAQRNFSDQKQKKHIHLTTFALKGVLSLNTSASSEFTDRLFETCPNLEHLELSRCRDIWIDETKMLADSAIKYNTNNSLKILNLERSPNINDACIESIARAFPNLTSLDLTLCARVTGNGLIKIAEAYHRADGQSSLHTLRILHTNVSDESLQRLAQSSLATSLRELQVYCRPITDAGAIPIATSFVNLTSLNMGNAAMSLIRTQFSFASTTFVPSFTLLRCLDLSYTLVTDGTLENFASGQGLPLLSELRLEGCSEIHDEGAKIIATAFKNLTLLDINSCIGIGEAGFIELASGLENLTSLDISGCATSIRKGLRVLSSSSSSSSRSDDIENESDENDQNKNSNILLLPNLRTFKLGVNLELNGQDLQHVYSERRNITSLSVSGCSQLCNADIEKLASKNMRNLKELDISRCHSVTSQCLSRLSIMMPLLQRLNLEDCFFSIEHVNHLVKFKNLQWVNVNGCQLYGPKADQFREKMENRCEIKWY